jgi:hypothetical protein
VSIVAAGPMDPGLEPLRVGNALALGSAQILIPLDLGEYLPFGDLLTGQATVLARPAAEVDGESGHQRANE